MNFRLKMKKLPSCQLEELFLKITFLKISEKSYTRMWGRLYPIKHLPVQRNDVILVSLSMFHTVFLYFYCWLWTFICFLCCFIENVHIHIFLSLCFLKRSGQIFVLYLWKTWSFDLNSCNFLKEIFHREHHNGCFWKTVLFQNRY